MIRRYWVSRGHESYAIVLQLFSSATSSISCPDDFPVGEAGRDSHWDGTSSDQEMSGRGIWVLGVGGFRRRNGGFDDRGKRSWGHIDGVYAVTPRL